MPIIDTQPLLAFLRAQFRIDWQGHHGILHWARVRVNGLMLAPETGANMHVVELVAFCHDSRWLNEHEDEGHGSRRAALARKLQGRFFGATDAEMDLLQYACDFHSDVMKTGGATVLTCWDVRPAW